MPIKREPFGQLEDGRQAELFTLTNAHGLIARITNYGATLTELHVPDRQGKLATVVLGFENLQGYLADVPYFGCVVGRYANRIARGRFTLNGVEYQLACNNGRNFLHGGRRGFDKVLWEAEPRGSRAVQFTYRSPDGEEGFPGNLDVQVTYTLTDDDELNIEYTATTDAPTVVNLTNHTYFNLQAPGKVDVLYHKLMLAADAYTPSDEELIPTGEIAPVEGTPYDFRELQTIGSRMDQTPGGYDTNFVIRRVDAEGKPLPDGALALAARLEDGKTGRAMEIWTTEPGIQFYTGNFLDGSLSGIGGTFNKHGGLCLEAQHFPDSPNQPSFPTTVLRPGETYRQITEHRFSVMD